MAPSVGSHSTKHGDLCVWKLPASPMDSLVQNCPLPGLRPGPWLFIPRRQSGVFPPPLLGEGHLLHASVPFSLHRHSKKSLVGLWRCSCLTFRAPTSHSHLPLLRGPPRWLSVPYLRLTGPFHWGLTLGHRQPLGGLWSCHMRRPLCRRVFSPACRAWPIVIGAAGPHD